MVVQRIIELLGHKTIYPETILQLYFVKEDHSPSMQGINYMYMEILVCTMYMYLKAGIQKTTFGFGAETDRLLSKLPKSQSRSESHLDTHPAYAYLLQGSLCF